MHTSTSSFSLLTLAMGLIACGRPNTINQDVVLTGIQNDVACESAKDCPGATCDPGSGACVPYQGDACLRGADCGPTEFCLFTPAPSPWVPGTEGVCAPSCGSDRPCPVGQLCQGGVCFTQVSCQESNNNTDCAPGEVCDFGTCSAPPELCQWDTDCPNAWICNTDATCIDPSNVSLGGCSTSEDCNAVQGCQGGLCECDADGACVLVSGCSSASECGDGNYCDNGSCRKAEACDPAASLDQCLPLGLVCDDGYCVGPEPCGANNTCPTGYICRQNMSPPGCFPTDQPQCTADSQCGPGTYCELFTGTCEPGCRNSSECVGQCSGLVPCNCDGTHACINSGVGQVGSACSTDAQCPGGTRCTYDDPVLAAFGTIACGSGFPIPGTCEKTCHQMCSVLANAFINTCPVGQVCGGSQGGLFQTAFLELFNGLIDPAGGGSVCYP